MRAAAGWARVGASTRTTSRRFVRSPRCSPPAGSTSSTPMPAVPVRSAGSPLIGWGSRHRPHVPRVPVQRVPVACRPGARSEAIERRLARITDYFLTDGTLVASEAIRLRIAPPGPHSGADQPDRPRPAHLGGGSPPGAREARGCPRSARGRRDDGAARDAEGAARHGEGDRRAPARGRLHGLDRGRRPAGRHRAPDREEGPRRPVPPARRSRRRARSCSRPSTSSRCRASGRASRARWSRP